MLILILFAFIAGIVTILSPCILPILPIVLSGSVVGGKRRPLGIVTGFVMSFTFFTLFLSTVVKLTGIPSDTLRLVSVFVLILFGMSLLLPQFQLIIEKLFSRFTPRAQNNSTGFFGGLTIGFSLGLLWAPCVGPILASVITLAATSTITFQTIAITAAYATGTAIPMLAIIYGGQKLITQTTFLKSKTSLIQKTFGVILILVAVSIYLNFDRKFQTFILEAFPSYGTGLTRFEDNQKIQKELERLTKPMPVENRGKPMFELTEDFPVAPELIGGQEWFNVPTDKTSLTLEQLRGKVVLIDFWTYTCINCIRTLPYLRSWHEKYKDKGLVIIGVHTPEFEFEKSAANVEAAIADFKLEYPVVQDNDYAIWNAYHNRYWPAKYFIDKNGKIRSTHFGEGAYDESEKIIQELLAETGVNANDEMTDLPIESNYARTPELYLGYQRLLYSASPEKIQEDKTNFYSIPEKLAKNTIAYGGNWTIAAEFAKAEEDSALDLSFEAKKVFLVMRSVDGTEKNVRVFLDGVQNSIITVTEDKLYNLIELPTPGAHRLHLEFVEGTIEVYAFTFG